jgi:hypothetical protein
MPSKYKPVLFDRRKLGNGGRKHGDLTGRRFGRLVVLKFDRMEANSHSVYTLQCDCGKVLERVKMWKVTRGTTRSCGCLRLESISRPMKHLRGYSSATKTHNWIKFRNAIKRKQERGIACDEWTIDSWYAVASRPCVYCGRTDIRNKLSNSSVRARTVPHATDEEAEKYSLPCNSIDRIDSSIGYTAANCVPCCVQCNRAKLDYSDVEFLQMVKLIYENRGLHGH